MRTADILLGIAAIALISSEACGGYYLYTPTALTLEQTRTKGEDDVAVREITVVKGDSLYRISRRTSGRGMYYPQILLFNKIANPNLIYPGQVLRVPFTSKAAISISSGQSSAPLTTPALATPPEPAPAPTSRATMPQPAATPPQTPPTVNAAPISSPAIIDNTAEQALFAKGVRAYKADKCRQAITAFDQFLNRYADSALAADATLYRADCYLKLGSE